MACTFSDLGEQFFKAWGKYEAFRKRPSKDAKKEYKDAMDVLESMIPKYNTGSGKNLNPNKQEQIFLDFIRDRKLLEERFEGHYNLQHDIDDGFADLEDAFDTSGDTARAAKIRKALDGPSTDLDDVLEGLDLED